MTRSEVDVYAEHIARVQITKLRSLLRTVTRSNPFYRHKLAGSGLSSAEIGADLPTEAADERLRELLARLPLTTKAELQDDQSRRPPYGSNTSFPLERYVRLHRTSGTTGRSLTWLDTVESWDWFVECWCRVWLAVGLRQSDRIFFPFSFGPFIGFWGAFESACRLGRFCLPAGGLTSAVRARYLIDHGATVVACTPTYALHLAEVAGAEGLDLRSSAVRLLVVAGEPGGNIPATRERIEEAWGARCLDHHGMTEIGCASYEPEDRPGGLHLIDTEFIAEVLAPDSDTPVPEGETGELVLTNLGRVGSPLIRYRTGDLVRRVEVEHASPHDPSIVSRTRLEGGILGRVDDMFFIRGNNVYPSAVEAVIREFREVAEYRLRVLQSGPMSALTVEIEPHADGERPSPESSSADRPRPEAPAHSASARDGGADPRHQPRAEGAEASPGPGFVAGQAGSDLAERIERAIQRRLLFRAQVRIVEPGTLPRFELKARRVSRE